MPLMLKHSGINYMVRMFDNYPVIVVPQLEGMLLRLAWLLDDPVYRRARERGERASSIRPLTPHTPEERVEDATRSAGEVNTDNEAWEAVGRWITRDSDESESGSEASSEIDHEENDVSDNRIDSSFN